MHVVELACTPARVTGAAQNGTVTSTEGPYHVVFAISHQQVLLAWVSRECEIIDRAIAQGLLPQKEFLQEFTLFRKNLESVVNAVTGVDKSVIGQVDAVEWSPELPIGRGAGIIRPRVRIGRHTPICAPHPLEFSAIGIEDNDTPIPVAIGDVQFASFFIHLDTRRTTQQDRVQAIHWLLGWVSNLGDELPVIREFERLSVRGAISGDPHIASLVDEDAVFRSRPVIP